MKKVNITKRMVKSLPSGVALFNCCNMQYYLFNAPYGKINEGMFSNDIKKAFKYCYKYIYESKKNELFVLTQKEKTNFMKGDK